MQIIPKNSREEIRVELCEYNGKPILNARVWWKDDAGEFFPSRKGLTVSAKHLPAFTKAINTVLAEARDCGVTDEGQNDD